jgi:hypothetical protein
MPKRDIIRIVQTDLLEHPATQAWRQLHIGNTKPERIEILKRHPRDQQIDFKKLVCRLAGVGPEGSAVIGKRCKRTSAMIERIIYEEFLPYLPVPSLNYYGMVEEADSKFCWLFLEDAGGELNSAQLAEHRILIAQWLGQMHASSTQIMAASRLPPKGPNHYLHRLKSAREAIQRHVVNRTFQSEDLITLEAIVRHCDLLESHWDRVEALCEGIPRTLVHGDFAGKNFGVRISRPGAAVLPFDWAEAGWGTPAVDIRKADIDAYLSAVRNHWPWLDVQMIRQMALAGRIFRCIDSIHWEQSSLKYVWLSTPMNNMRIYESRIANVIGSTGFGK